MENNRSFSDMFVENVMKVVYKVLRKEKLLQSEFHMGIINQVISNKQLSVFVDGSNIAQTIRCNPDVTFSIGEQVIVIFINNDPKNKYVMSRILF